MMAAGAALALALWLLLPPVGVGGVGPPPIQDGEFTFLLPAGRKQCFYQSAPANASLETEYQVIGGAGLDVDFSLESPQGELLVSESRKADGVHTTISEKLVFFELIFDSLQDEEEEGWAEVVEPEEMLDVKMEDIKESMETMRTRLERSIQILTLLRAFEARDRNLQEGNLERVNFWSAVNVAVLLLVAVAQRHGADAVGSSQLGVVVPARSPEGDATAVFLPGQSLYETGRDLALQPSGGTGWGGGCGSGYRASGGGPARPHIPPSSLQGPCTGLRGGPGPGLCRSLKEQKASYGLRAAVNKLWSENQRLVTGAGTSRGGSGSEALGPGWSGRRKGSPTKLRRKAGWVPMEVVAWAQERNQRAECHCVPGWA
ncbi:transmembrane emp24 domain-containing protein 1 isoform X2 [Tamandua tetradactyla]|uniref:transmembrane emp24 domain-containing protein 1 isoform X2 n=1 Tax=Tamandua tetradactyla TaxID=48850 RepID=UPI0040537CFE